MEEPVQQEQDEQQERQDLEYNDPNEDQGNFEIVFSHVKNMAKVNVFFFLR